MGRRKASERREPVFDVAPGPEPAITSDDAVAAPQKPAPRKRKKGPEAKRRQGPHRLRPRCLLGRGRFAVAGDRGDRRRRCDRHLSAADPVARNPKAATVDPDRRHQQSAAGDARRILRRAGLAQGAPATRAAGVHRHRGPALLFPLGRRSDRRVPCALRQSDAARRRARRLDHHAAARQEPVPDPRAHPDPQGSGGRAGVLAGAQIQQDRDHRALSQPRLFRRRRLRHRGGGAALLQQAGAEAERRRSRHARRSGAFAVTACAEP